MPRWTVPVGDEDIIVIERNNITGTVVIDIPTRRPVPVDRDAVEDLRRKLGAALAVDGDQ